jgi:tetratricopeptide (TPR) repeat protein
LEALVGIALVNVQFAGYHMSDDRVPRLAAAEALANRALSLAPDHPRGRTCLGLTYIYSNRAAQGIAQCERALALDRNLAVAHGYIGMAKYFVGRGEETEGDIDESFRLSPRDTFAYFWRALAGIAKVFLGRYEEAVARLRQSIEINGNFSTVHFYLAVALAELDRLDEARIAVQDGLALDPRFTILRYRNSAPSDNPTFMRARERHYVAMRKAGVPEE